VKSSRYNRSRSEWGLAVVGVTLGASACGLIGQTLKPTISEGQQFAHYIEFPQRFQVPNTVQQETFVFDQYTFRISRSSPDVVLVAACAYVELAGHKFEPSSRVCSPNAFAIDTERGYVVREAGADEWGQASPIEDEKEMDDPVRRTLKQELAKPRFLRAIPIDASQGRGAYYDGYTYRGQEYRRRGDWIVSLAFANSNDGKLAVLAGVDKRSLPKHGFLGDPVNASYSGLVTIDVFAGDSSHRIAALDVDSHINVNAARRRMSLVNSRWIAIGLDTYLQKMLLLDFKPTDGSAK
jgi:hypothetical protein